MYHISQLFFSKERTFPFLCLESFYSSNFDIWEEFMNLLFRNSLIIAKDKDIRSKCTNWSKYIFFISENSVCFSKGMSHIFLPNFFIVFWFLSFYFLNTMITSNYNRHFLREFLCLRKVENMSWMKYIKCTKTHHMVKFLFWMRFMKVYFSFFASGMWRFGESHKEGITSTKQIK